MTATLAKFEKQPNDVQDYDFDFTDYIEGCGESVGAAHTFSAIADTGLDIDSTSIVSGIGKVWTSAGIDGESYKVTGTLETAGGRTKEAEITVKVKER